MTEAEYNLRLWAEYVRDTEFVDLAHKERYTSLGTHFANGGVAFLYKIYYAICEQERFCIEEQMEFSYENEGEDFLLTYQGDTCIFTETEIRNFIINMIGIFEHTLPLGSVVDLNKVFLREGFPVDEVERIRVVITHRFVGEGAGGLYYPYAATIYPIGIPGSKKIIEFTPALIENIVFEGFSDEQELAYVYLMKQELLLQKGFKSIGLVNELEWKSYIPNLGEEIDNVKYIKA